MACLALAAGSILYVVDRAPRRRPQARLKELATWGIVVGLFLGFATDWSWSPPALDGRAARPRRQSEVEVEAGVGAGREHAEEAAVEPTPGPGTRRPSGRRPRADQEADPGGAVVGPVRAVLLARAAELRPEVDEHPVGEAARLEVALEREEGSAVGFSASRARRAGPRACRNPPAPRERRSGAAVRREHRGKPGQPRGNSSFEVGYAAGR